MTRIQYTSWRPGPVTEEMVRRAESVCRTYQRQGFDLTLRQLYYQFVAHDWFPEDRRFRWVEATRRWVRDPNGTKNADPNYKWLGDIITQARMAGLMSWSYIVDRTRAINAQYHWRSPGELLSNTAGAYVIDLWEGQPRRVEVWVEKDALSGIIESAADPWDVPSFACKGYTSVSAMWGAAQRIGRHLQNGYAVTILHLGDHDPSGIDMTRDIEERLTRFLQQDWYGRDPDIGDSGAAVWDDIQRRLQDPDLNPFRVDRIALNMDQVREYNPPPNPAKLGDSRSAAYVEEFGELSWELDALDPDTLSALISSGIEELLDRDLFDARQTEQDREQRRIQRFADRWEELAGELDEEED